MRISDWSSDVCSSDLEGLELIGDGLGLCDRPFHGCVLLDQRVLVDHQARLEGGDLVGGIEVLGRKPIDFLGDETVARVAVVFETLVKPRSEEHTSELQSLMRISYAVFCLKKQK